MRESMLRVNAPTSGTFGCLTASDRRKGDNRDESRVVLPPGSLLYMSALVQTDWLHAVKREPGAGPRISMTWRRMRLRTIP
jgi:hypothetical protein